MLDVAPQAESLSALVRAAARELSNSQTPMLDARLLAEHAFKMSDAELIRKADRPAEKVGKAKFLSLIARRQAGEPVAHIVGEKEFWSLKFRTAPGVLVPRPDSETLIEAAIARRDRSASYAILDLGTGSGCLLCALLSEFRQATGCGVDISHDAVALAENNATLLGMKTRATFQRSSWDSLAVTLGSGVFDIIVTNPPYIPEGDFDGLPIDVRAYEDPAALISGPAGLDAYDAILAEAPRLIANEGLIVIEIGDGQSAALRELARRAFPGAEIEEAPDLSGAPRALIIDLAKSKKNL